MTRNGKALDTVLNHPPAAKVRFWLKAVIFALLALNAGIFLRSGTLGEGLDSIAWLILLVLFELETGFGQVLRVRSAIAAVHGVRFAALTAIGAAAAGFLYNEEWLDAANSGLWIAVAALLELEIRRPAAVAMHRARFAAVTAALYSALAALVLVWAWRGAWFDAYDAVLWLTAFATIEMNVLGAKETG